MIPVKQTLDITLRITLDTPLLLDEKRSAESVATAMALVKTKLAHELRQLSENCLVEIE